MIPGFEKIVEDRIRKAQKEGSFDNLKGSFKPLEFEEYNGPDELRLAHKILKNAGFLPPEIELRKKISHVEELLNAAGNDSEQKLGLEKTLKFLMTRLDLMRQDASGFSLMNSAYGNAIRKTLS